MRLTDLNPQFLGAGGPGVYQRTDRRCLVCDGKGGAVGCDVCYQSGFAYEQAPRREGVGLMFNCPHGDACLKKVGVEFPEDAGKHYVSFANPLDGGEPFEPNRGPHWQRIGDTVETLTLTPSIFSKVERGGCGWHGFITNGEIITV